MFIQADIVVETWVDILAFLYGKFIPLFCYVDCLHIRSMWETICDALASWSGWEFGSKIPVYPILGFSSQNTAPPPPENWNLCRSLHFKTFQFWLVENTPLPLPRKLKLGRSLHFKTFQFWLVENTPRRYVETNICIPHGYRLVWTFDKSVWERKNPLLWTMFLTTAAVTRFIMTTIWRIYKKYLI